MKIIVFFIPIFLSNLIYAKDNDSKIPFLVRTRITSVKATDETNQEATMRLVDLDIKKLTPIVKKIKSNVCKSIGDGGFIKVWFSGGVKGKIYVAEVLSQGGIEVTIKCGKPSKRRSP